MRFGCLINNYNYGRFLTAAVESVFNQTTKFDQVIIVDDFSTDNSRTILAELATRFDTLKLIFHETNRGQYSTMKTAFENTDVDVVCFLDSDDVYDSEYLNFIKKSYAMNSNCDFLFCNALEFTALSELQPFKMINACDILSLGRSMIQTRFGDPTPYIGASTSTLSMRNNFASLAFTIPWEDDWRINADDCLVYGTSLAGARKFRLNAALVGYRVHGSNGWHKNTQAQEPDAVLWRQFSRVRLIEFYAEKFKITLETARLANLEMKTNESIGLTGLKQYIMIVLRYGPPKGATRIRTILGMLFWWARKTLRTHSKMQLL
jgi:glycosyltransferase involved in cell wall biosynthesis